MIKFRVLILISCLLFGLSGCHATYYKVPVTKSKKRILPYNPKKDKSKKRTKIRNFKSLKHSKNINDH